MYDGDERRSHLLGNALAMGRIIAGTVAVFTGAQIAEFLAPRLAHFILPIPGKGGSDWSYGAIAVIGPIIGGVIGAWAYTMLWTVQP